MFAAKGHRGKGSALHGPGQGGRSRGAAAAATEVQIAVRRKKHGGAGQGESGGALHASSGDPRHAVPPTALPSAKRKSCKHWQRHGTCKFGDECWFSHPQAGQPGGNQTQQHHHRHHPPPPPPLHSLPYDDRSNHIPVGGTTPQLGVAAPQMDIPSSSSNSISAPPAVPSRQGWGQVYGQVLPQQPPPPLPPLQHSGAEAGQPQGSRCPYLQRCANNGQRGAPQGHPSSDWDAGRQGPPESYHGGGGYPPAPPPLGPPPHPPGDAAVCPYPMVYYCGYPQQQGPHHHHHHHHPVMHAGGGPPGAPPGVFVASVTGVPMGQQHQQQGPPQQHHHHHRQPQEPGDVPPPRYAGERGWGGQQQRQEQQQGHHHYHPHPHPHHQQQQQQQQHQRYSPGEAVLPYVGPAYGLPVPPGVQHRGRQQGGSVQAVASSSWDEMQWQGDVESDDGTADSTYSSEGMAGLLQHGWFTVHLVPEGLFGDDGELTTNYEVLLSLDRNKVEIGIPEAYLRERLAFSPAFTADIEGELCTICREDFTEEDIVKNPIASLPCSHKYHFSCVSEWLRKCTRCPVCNWDSWDSEARTIITK